MEPVASLAQSSSNGDAANGRESSAAWGQLEFWAKPSENFPVALDYLHSGPDGGLAATCTSDNSLLHQYHPALSSNNHMYSGGHDTGADFNSSFDLLENQQGGGILDPGQFMSVGSSSGAGLDISAYSLPGVGGDFLQHPRAPAGQRSGGASRQQQGMTSMGVPNIHHSALHCFGNEALDPLAGGPVLLAHNGFPISYGMQGTARQGMVGAHSSPSSVQNQCCHN